MSSEKRVSMAGMDEQHTKAKLSARCAIVLLVSAIFIMGIPSLPAQKYHLLFWAIALILEIALLIALWPPDSN